MERPRNVGKEGIIGRTAKAHLILERLGSGESTDEALIFSGERILFLGDNPQAINAISLCRLRDANRIFREAPSPKDKIVVRVEEEAGSDFKLSNTPDEIQRETFYEAIYHFSDGSWELGNRPPGHSPFSVFISGDTLIPRHGIHKLDWEDIKLVIDMVEENEERVEAFFEQETVRELLRRMRLIAEMEPDPSSSNKPKPNTIGVTLRFG